MPELPDLTVYAENLARKVVGKKIDNVLFHNRGRLNVSSEELARALSGAEITGVRRTGKQVSFYAANQVELRVHLMLTGGFFMTGAADLERLDSPVLSICFADGSALSVADPKGWATVTLNPKDEKEAPDALDVDIEFLKTLFGKKPKAMLKSLLLDQNLIGGIGNAYADEILWMARISPKSIAGKLPPEAVCALADAIPAVLLNAIQQLKRRHPDMIAGEFREFLKVHNPALKVSESGARIIKENVQSKRTYYTDEQKLYR
ncbi:MAG TPA: formamidopyrimidine-DNA glycosylase [Geobacter sp.]|nr:formamidopyrimidine-DNA glycosylase [Geobacter sp.]